MNNDPYKVKILKAMLTEIGNDEWFIPIVKAPGKEIHNINLDDGAIKVLIKYYGGDIECT